MAAVLAGTLAAACGTGGSPSGLVLDHDARLANDAFDRPAPASSLAPAFRLGGTATSAHGTARLGSGGLFIDVDSRRPGLWRGYFVATAATYPADAVIHVRMWRPSPSVPRAGQSGISLLAIQTGASSALDYVLVAGAISQGHESWLVGYAHGSTAYAKTTILKDLPSTATTEDVTVRTDGRSHLDVYFGDTLVYATSALRLGVAPPFRVYLEVEERGFPYRTRFQQLWVTTGTDVRVGGLHPGDRVTLTPDGRPPVEAVADATGRARLALPVSEAVGTGTFTIEGARGERHFRGVAFAGGDVFTLHP